MDEQENKLSKLMTRFKEDIQEIVPDAEHVWLRLDYAPKANDYLNVATTRKEDN